jgi:hypothetical protein
MRRIGIALVMVAVLVGACRPGNGPDSPQQAGPADVLDWDHAPDTIVFQAMTVGSGGQLTSDYNRIPFCTLYGDGHVIWVDPYADPEQVLEDRIAPDTMRDFLRNLINSGFYDWQASTRPVALEGPLMDRAMLNLYGTVQAVDSQSNWPPAAFADMTTRCQTLSTAPVLYLPDGAWMSAVEVTPRPDAPGIPWETYAEDFPQVDLATLTLDNPQWITGDLLRVMWRLARDGRIQLRHNDAAYGIVLQVPGLHPGALDSPDN